MGSQQGSLAIEDEGGVVSLTGLGKTLDDATDEADAHNSRGVRLHLVTGAARLLGIVVTGVLGCR